MAKWTSQKLAGAGGHRSAMLLKGRLVDSHLGALCTRCQDLSVSALISLCGEPILCLLQHLLDLKCCWVYSVSFSFGVWSEKFSIRNREGLSLRIPKGLWSVAGTLGTGDGRGWGGPSSPRYRLSTDYSRCTNTDMLNFCSPKDGHLVIHSAPKRDLLTLNRWFHYFLHRYREDLHEKTSLFL